MSHQFVRMLAAVALVGIVACGDDDGPPPDGGPDGDTAVDGVCGNKKLEEPELCDGADLGGETCRTVGDGLYSGGRLACKANCTFDISKCTGGDASVDIDGGGGGTGG